MVVPPGYFISELIRDKWPSEHSAIGVGISGGLWDDSQVEFRDARFKEEEETVWAVGSAITSRAITYRAITSAAPARVCRSP